MSCPICAIFALECSNHFLAPFPPKKEEGKKRKYQKGMRKWYCRKSPSKLARKAQELFQKGVGSRPSRLLEGKTRKKKKERR